jgi:flagellar motor switch protein FliM
MKPEPKIVAGRALAQHCDRLIRCGPDCHAMAQELAQRLAGPLRIALQPLVPADLPHLTVTAPATRLLGECRGGDAGLAAEMLFDTATGATIGAIIDGTAIVRLVDRCFGGAGNSKDPAPTFFSPAARVMIERLEDCLASALAEALGLESTDALAVRPRDDRFVLTKPLASDLEMLVLDVSVEESDQPEWRISVVVPLAQVTQLLSPAAPRMEAGAFAHANGASPSSPWDDLPLDLAAVLVDMTVPISCIARFEIGAIIPVSVARQVRLCVDDRTLAHGSLGQVDDHLALRIERASASISFNKELS